MKAQDLIKKSFERLVNEGGQTLAQAGVYNKLIQKRIIALTDIRNNADHGHFKEFTKADVEDMVKWIRGLSADYLK